MELTTRQAAAEIGIHPLTARRLCAQHGIGRLVNPRLRLLTSADVSRLRRLKKAPGWQHGATKTRRKSNGPKEL